MLALAAVAIAIALGCGGDPEPPAAVPGPCPSGSIAWTDGSCMAVGIQGCAEMFMEDDGLCHPRMEKCPAGTIPKFDEGCVPVGIQGCAEMFMEDDGLCHPSMDKCPGGTIPKFDQGCVPVGIQWCADAFVEGDGLCHPTIDKCPAETFAVPQLGCVPIDGPDGCGSGTWGNLYEEPGVATIWVDPSVAASGDGSQASPVKSIAEALTVVPAGGRIALGAGTYDEPIHITKPMTIEGRCPSMVRVQGTGIAGGTTYIVWVDAADDVTLRGLEIGGAGLGVRATGAMGLTLDGLHLRNATIVGLVLDGTEVSIARTWIEGTLAGNGVLGGRGVEMGAGAWVMFTDSAIVANREIGVIAVGAGTDVTLTDSLVEGTLPEAGSAEDGRGVDVEGGATLALIDSAVVRNHEVGVVAFEDATRVSLVGSLVERTLPVDANAQAGNGVLLVAGADATIAGTAVLRNRSAGVHAQDQGTDVAVIGSLVEGTLPDQSNGECASAVALRGAKLTLGESAITGGYGVGLIAAEQSATVTATGVLVEGQLSRGVFAYSGGIAVVDRSAVIENRKIGVSSQDAKTDVTVTGSLVAGTLSNAATGKSGRGVEVLNGARATLGANAIVENRDMGISVEGAGAEVMATENLVAGTLPRDNDGGFGRGANADRGATLLVDGNALVANHELGLYAGGAGTVLTAMGNLVEGTLPQESDDLLGRGVGVELGAQATLEANAIVANHEAGLFVDASAAIVTGNLIEGTLPREIDGQFGIGVVCADQATLQLVSSLVHDNRVSALLVANAAASVSESLIDVVQAGSVTGDDPTGIINDVGDGLLAMLGSTLDITDTRVQGCARAGLLFDDSSGTLSGVTSTENQFGLVLQGNRRPSYEGGENQLTGNRTQDVVTSGALLVPGGASLVPRSP